MICAIWSRSVAARMRASGGSGRRRGDAGQGRVAVALALGEQDRLGVVLFFGLWCRLWCRLRFQLGGSSNEMSIGLENSVGGGSGIGSGVSSDRLNPCEQDDLSVELFFGRLEAARPDGGARCSAGGAAGRGRRARIAGRSAIAGLHRAGRRGEADPVAASIAVLSADSPATARTTKQSAKKETSSVAW